MRFPLLVVLGALVVALAVYPRFGAPPASATTGPQHAPSPYQMAPMSEHADHMPLAAPPGQTERIGQVEFPVSCSAAVQPDFNRAVALLHSFWYVEALNAFDAIAQAEPTCAMAHWGVAMSLWNQIWAPPPAAALERGLAAVEQATALGASTPREQGFIAAAAAFFRDAATRDHAARAQAYAQAMEQLYQAYPDDPEVKLFYALALQAAADPRDKTYANQLRSAALAEEVFAANPDHPGAAHYLIHAYDYPPLAERAIAAAERYDQFAPSVPHALHMPSHIWILLGRWPETIEGNRRAAEAERTRGTRDDLMHALDYLLYAYLQQAQDRAAGTVLEEERAVVAGGFDAGRHTAPFAMAAGEARWALERGRWAEAAAIEPRPSAFPYTEAMLYLARGLGAARSGDAAAARAALERLTELRDVLTAARNAYWAEQVDIQRGAVAAWLAWAEGRNEEAVALMRAAADQEAATEKHNVTPGPVVQARELLGDLLLELGRPAEALVEYQASQQTAPNRFKGYYGVARAAALAGAGDQARAAYSALLALTAPGDGDRPELQQARDYLAQD